jgi:NAD(P)-dependent dehydrogenase (short-subunit alcohol dehydrogenase family)
LLTITALYCATKSAVIGLTRCDAIDYSHHLIRVNAVCPGIIDTPMTTRPKPGSTDAAPPVPAVDDGKPKAAVMDLSTAVDLAPMKRMGTADEVADVVLFLCSEKASFVQGAAWLVDGGYVIN